MGRRRAADGDLPAYRSARTGHPPPGLSRPVLPDPPRGAAPDACDAVPTYESLKGDVPPGWYVDLRDCCASLQRASDIADMVLPSHDVRVLSQPHCPASPDGGAV